MDSPDRDTDERRLAAIVPARLAAADDRDKLPDSVVTEDHKHVVEVALTWQRYGGLASFWEMGATHQGAEPDRAYALAGQMAATGEQLGLASAACNEVAIWRDYRERETPDVAHELCMRGMAEAQCLFVMSTGHAFANVGLKALALDGQLKAKLIEGLKIGSTSFPPLSIDRRDWVSMNRPTCEALGAVAESSEDSEVIKMIEPLVQFGLGAAWRDLDGRRGEDFHRWRLQTHGVEGVARKTPWSSDGKTRMLKIGRVTYDEAEGLADEVAGIGEAAMLDLAGAMSRFREHWFGASARLGGPDFGAG